MNRTQKWAKKYPERAAATTLRARTMIAKMRRVVASYKESLGCEACGVREAVVLDLHHPDPRDKELNIGSNMNVGRARIWREILKCRVLCKNDHARQHISR